MRAFEPIASEPFGRICCFHRIRSCAKLRVKSRFLWCKNQRSLANERQVAAQGQLYDLLIGISAAHTHLTACSSALSPQRERWISEKVQPSSNTLQNTQRHKETACICQHQVKNKHFLISEP